MSRAADRAKATARQRRYRDRLRHGAAVLRVRVADYFDLVGVLIDAAPSSIYTSKLRNNRSLVRVLSVLRSV